MLLVAICTYLLFNSCVKCLKKFFITISGCYSGVATFQRALATEKNIHISQHEIAEALKKNSTYLMHLTPKRKFPRRKYNVFSYGQMFEADIADFYDYKGFKKLLVVVDVFSRKIFARILKTKSKQEVQDGFKSIFQEAGTTPSFLSSDRNEYINLSIANLLTLLLHEV